MKLSEISAEEVKLTLRIDYDWDDRFVDQIIESAKSYLVNATAKSIDDLDEIPEMNIAFYCLCGDMYDNRSNITDNNKENPTVQKIIAMHRVNYL